MITQQSLQVFQSITAEQKSIDFYAEEFKSKVRRREKGSSNMFGGIVQYFEKTSFCESELKGAELAGKEFNDFDGFWWWNQDAVYRVNDAIGPKLLFISRIEMC